MEVQVLHFKLESYSLPAHDDPTRNSGGRSWGLGRNQTSLQDQNKMTLALKGSLHDETEPKKATYLRAECNT